ncbi:MAG: galactokinase [Microthrixaceae bacterium]
MASPQRVRARASGRVNLIGDHTDYMGGLAMPMTINHSTVVEGVRGGDSLSLVSDSARGRVEVGLPVKDPGAAEPEWARYPAAVAAELHAAGALPGGFAGAVTSDVPRGAGLSSSAALEIAVALALGSPLPESEKEATELAKLCQRAEHAAVGLPSGLMDQLSICTGRSGHATLIDFDSLEVEQVAMQTDAHIWVIHSGQARRLDSSAYAERRRSAEAAEELLGPLPRADLSAIGALADPLLARRARHVRSECDRVRQFAEFMAQGDLGSAGSVMAASHASLRRDYEVSTPALDQLVDALASIGSVYGARLTGAGFGGCVVALTSEEFQLSALGDDHLGWEVHPVDGIDLQLG